MFRMGRPEASRVPGVAGGPLGCVAGPGNWFPIGSRSMRCPPFDAIVYSKAAKNVRARYKIATFLGDGLHLRTHSGLMRLVLARKREARRVRCPEEARRHAGVASLSVPCVPESAIGGLGGRVNGLSGGQSEEHQSDIGGTSGVNDAGGDVVCSADRLGQSAFT